jgi:predicted small metal-binding protein
MPSQSESAANRSGNSALSGEQNISFRCKDVGYGDCPWETKGRDEKEVFNNIERHGREQHGLKEWTEDLRNKVRNAFNRRAA